MLLYTASKRIIGTSNTFIMYCWLNKLLFNVTHHFIFRDTQQGYANSAAQSNATDLKTPSATIYWCESHRQIKLLKVPCLATILSYVLKLYPTVYEPV